MKFNTVDINSFDDFRIGNSESRSKGTGCTVIICEKGAVGGVDVRGGGPATRETDLLRSENSVESVYAVVLSGGSAFGLEASSGVMRELRDRGIGLHFEKSVIPIVCGASLYDLEVGDPKAFPDIEMGKDAVRKAFNGSFRNGNSGAGTGCTVGKLKGMSRAMKTGLGTFACTDGGLEVGAVAAVNAVGDIYNGAGNIIAGLRTEDGKKIYGTIRTFKNMVREDTYEPSVDDTIIIDTRDIAEAQSRIEHEARMTEIAEAIRDEFRKTSGFSKEEIISAMEAVMDDIPEETLFSGSGASPEDEYYLEGYEGHESLQSPEEAETYGKHNRHGAAEAEARTEAPAEAAGSAAEEAHEGYASDEDLGYDIPFNTTIGCLVTNAKLTKPQANKLASILHDAYARAIKPVHSTYDGDTIFVLATGRYEVNFDAFAALATDVMQYAIIDGAFSAKHAYGLPAAGDLRTGGR